MSANLVFCSHNIFNSLELIRSLTSQFLSVYYDKDGTSPCRICILHNNDEINSCGQVPILPVNSPSVICQQLKKRGVINFAEYTVTPCPACILLICCPRRTSGQYRCYDRAVSKRSDSLSIILFFSCQEGWRIVMHVFLQVTISFTIQYQTREIKKNSEITGYCRLDTAVNLSGLQREDLSSV